MLLQHFSPICSRSIPLKNQKVFLENSCSNYDVSSSRIKRIMIALIQPSLDFDLFYCKYYAKSSLKKEIETLELK